LSPRTDTDAEQLAEALERYLEQPQTGRRPPKGA
jgi:hypothetical protein